MLTISTGIQPELPLLLCSVCVCWRVLPSPVQYRTACLAPLLSPLPPCQVVKCQIYKMITITARSPKLRLQCTQYGIIYHPVIAANVHPFRIFLTNDQELADTGLLRVPGHLLPREGVNWEDREVQVLPQPTGQEPADRGSCLAVQVLNNNRRVSGADVPLQYSSFVR